jgi:hypothetical protein
MTQVVLLLSCPCTGYHSVPFDFRSSYPSERPWLPALIALYSPSIQLSTVWEIYQWKILQWLAAVSNKHVKLKWVRQ